MAERRKTDRRTNPAVEEPLERKKERRRGDRRESIRRKTSFVVRQGKRSELVKGELGLGGASFVLEKAPKDTVVVDHPASSTEGLAAKVASTRPVSAGVEVHVTFGELETATALALAKWLDGA